MQIPSTRRQETGARSPGAGEHGGEGAERRPPRRGGRGRRRRRRPRTRTPPRRAATGTGTRGGPAARWAPQTGAAARPCTPRTGCATRRTAAPWPPPPLETGARSPGAGEHGGEGAEGDLLAGEDEAAAAASAREPELLLGAPQQGPELGAVQQRDGHHEPAPPLAHVHREVAAWHVGRQPRGLLLLPLPCSSTEEHEMESNRAALNRKGRSDQNKLKNRIS
jgi:hypothetical protein